jgi:hypothetical protein
MPISTHNCLFKVILHLTDYYFHKSLQLLALVNSNQCLEYNIIYYINYFIECDDLVEVIKTFVFYVTVILFVWF